MDLITELKSMMPHSNVNKIGIKMLELNQEYANLDPAERNETNFNLFKNKIINKLLLLFQIIFESNINQI